MLAYDEETGKQDYKTVLHLFRNESKDWVKVTVNGAEIESTPGHKYFLPKIKKWVSAEELKVGTKVLLSDGSYGIVEAVEHISYDTPQTTYNFEVEEYHTYYVGSQCVCVHNQNCGVSELHYKDLPDDARSAYDKYSQNGWKGNVKGQTTNAGGKWLNSEMQLPTSDSLGNALTYREFDIKMNMPRGSSRFVVSNQMQVYYTPNHYTTFFKIIGG